ncbi:hypothetical protein [Fodinicola feengrottensis]|uniref:hypothetical protein n=1 Tax=Fodinicola feengrottensis TaxID=435914 RepID=UPI0013D082D2|nr:hypothetical protein [Fodinicola feengrottensis]
MSPPTDEATAPPWNSHGLAYVPSVLARPVILTVAAGLWMALGAVGVVLALWFVGQWLRTGGDPDWLPFFIGLFLLSLTVGCLGWGLLRGIPWTRVALTFVGAPFLVSGCGSLFAIAAMVLMHLPPSGVWLVQRPDRRRPMDEDYLSAYDVRSADSLPVNIREELALRDEWKAGITDRARHLAAWGIVFAVVVDGQDRRYQVLGADGRGELPEGIDGSLTAADIHSRGRTRRDARGAADRGARRARSRGPTGAGTAGRGDGGWFRALPTLPSNAGKSGY